MGSKRGLLTGIFSGAATGAATGSTVGGIGAIPGAVIGGIVGGISGNSDDTANAEEQARIDEENRKKEQEQGFSHLLDLRNLRNQDRTAGMNTLQLLAADRATAEQNARRHALLRA